MSFVNMKKSLLREKPSTEQNLNVSRTDPKSSIPMFFPSTFMTQTSIIPRQIFWWNLTKEIIINKYRIQEITTSKGY